MITERYDIDINDNGELLFGFWQDAPEPLLRFFVEIWGNNRECEV